MTLPLPPHGGLNRLTARNVSEAEAKKLVKENAKAPKIVVTNADLSTVRRFGDGVLTPLEGPMTKKVFDEVLNNERIEVNGKYFAWGIPLSLPVTDAEAKKLKVGKTALIVDENGKNVAVLEVEDIFNWDKKFYNTKVYGTERMDHPGARIALNDPRTKLVGGKIHVLPFSYDRKDIVQKYVFSPDETRKKLKKSGWNAAVAFQTRNPLHRAHEYAMVYAVEKLTSEGKKAGVVLNPLVGETKGDDVPAAIRMQSYENLKKHRLLGQGDSIPKIWKKAGYELNDVFDLYALDMKMFYGGPREAIMHAIYRQNYGFSNIVIGRKHADAPYDDGKAIWGDFDAQERFSNLKGDLQIQPVKVGFAAYYDHLGRVGLIEDQPAGTKPVTVSGSVLRQQLLAGQSPDPRIIRPETSKILIEAYQKKFAQQNTYAKAQVVGNLTWHHHAVTQQMREAKNGHKGATLWFTGLSASGKSTIANELSAALYERGVQTYVLDGDNIRQGLNRGLGFSPEDRKENIRRIAEVAKLFTDAGIVNMTAFISPYREDRDNAKALQPIAGRFLEVYVKANVAACEKRDPKGLYKKARAGEIKDFTGISASAPYEEPKNPDIVVDTMKNSLAKCVALLVEELEKRGLIEKRGGKGARKSAKKTAKKAKK